MKTSMMKLAAALGTGRKHWRWGLSTASFAASSPTAAPLLSRNMTAPARADRPLLLRGERAHIPRS